MRILAVLLLMAVTAMFYVGFISYSGPSNTPALNGHDFGDVLPNQELIAHVHSQATMVQTDQHHPSYSFLRMPHHRVAPNQLGMASESRFTH